jgi:dolichol-phosphate mannosyltransferase
MINKKTIGVVIPSYKVSAYILDVIANIGPEVDKIYVVDDCCPEQVGELVKKNCFDERVTVITHEANEGVGGAVMTGYRAAILDDLDIVVKLDGDGQMDPDMLVVFVNPILNGKADYTKGNRFFDLEQIRTMPTIRIFGNALLSFMNKLSSGYWNIFDPTNGYTAIHLNVARRLPFSKISKGYFFESDMLFRLYTIKAVVMDIPMNAKYGDEVSNLKISRVWLEFLAKHQKNLIKRIFYSYYLRDMSLASIELPLGVFMFIIGIIYGGYNWIYGFKTGIPSSIGALMLSTLLVIIGLQLFLQFLAYDMGAVPQNEIHSSLYYKQGSEIKNEHG